MDLHLAKDRRHRINGFFLIRCSLPPKWVLHIGKGKKTCPSIPCHEFWPSDTIATDHSIPIIFFVKML